MFTRKQLKIIEKRINEHRKFIQVIAGPRQVGKTTLVRQLLKKSKKPYTFESADGISDANPTWLTQIWETARLIMKNNQHQEYLLVIDEIQKINNWSDIVKQQWDKDTNEGTNIKVIILGSSRLLIQKGLTESLAGRFETLHLGHWSFREMEEAFGWNLNQYIFFGGYPSSVDLITDEARWKNYINNSLIETTISKDILMLTTIHKPALLKQLFEIGVLYSGQILSYTKLIGQLQDAGNTTTLSHYLSLLSDCGLLRGIEKFSGTIIRKRSSSPKFQVFNNALLSARGNDSFQDIQLQPKLWGRLVESAIGTHLINHTMTDGIEVYYWRESNYEVDFIIKKDNKLIALEVKSGRKTTNRGIDIFSKKFNPHKILMVGTSGIPLDTFLKLNPVELF